MTDSMSTLIARVEALTGAAVMQHVRLGGGCIAMASRMDLADGRLVFAKGGAGAGGFAAEAAGLRALAEFDMRVPAVLHVDDAAMVLEWLDLEPVSNEAAWGKALATLHKRSAEAGETRFGFDVNGMLGSTPQDHSWCDDWTTFWRKRRLRPMLSLLRNGDVRQLGEAVDANLNALLDGGGQSASLIHGDLWSGNIAQCDGRPFTFDPAAYWADREAEFGMLRWMGGLGRDFEQAYADIWPLPPGADSRIDVYALHHHLNHLVLFGESYRAGCVRLMRRILG